jgi:hypothetical protein
LKCQNLRKLQRREKYKNWWKPRSFPTSSQSIGVRYPIIDNIVSLSYNWWNVMSRHFCKKIRVENLAKNLIVVEVQSPKNLSNKLPIFIAKIS